MASSRGAPLLYRNALGTDPQPDPLMRRRLLFFAALIAAIAFVPPLINLKRYQTRIAQTISGSIGRRVAFTDVRLRLLPRPGFTFSNLSVAEDPAFGME